MAGIYLVLAVVGAVGAGFLLFYKLHWEKRIDRKEVEDMLRKKGIGERPENITKRYYKIQGENLDEKRVRKLTNQYCRLNKEFFLTMFDNIKQKERSE